jgi:type VI protein secretion system component Hcp
MTVRKSLLAAAAITVLSLGAAAPSLAAGFLKAPDIEGAAKEEVHKGWIELNSISAAVKPAPAAKGRLIDNEGHAYLTATIFGSSAVSEKLKAAAASKRKMGEVKVEFVNDAGAVYLTIVMTDAVVRSVKPAGLAAGARPTEEVAFYYNRIAFDYVAPQDTAGKGKKGNVEFEWKVEEGES